MVTADDDGGLKCSVPHGAVECLRQASSAHSVRVKDARLRPHHQVMLTGLSDPPQVVLVLRFHHGGHFLYTETTPRFSRFRINGQLTG
ncbi:hypothetical protein L798_15739 [Zootermopsis nevadensis]|uniref:Uncharacterized protein n=1 Tax=Zootermopsis nevadensis TaxID=136037 RepID=A0A067RRC7_ZOONE|nr:hypothetical protein L798_15739 [Zootermopsis nevadensis]